VARAVLAGAALAAVLALNRPQPAQAGPRPTHTLTAVGAASLAYYVAEPAIGAPLTLDGSSAHKYVAPRAWDGTDFEPVVVEAVGSAADTDTAWLRSPPLYVWYSMPVPDAIEQDPLLEETTGDSGFTVTQPWNLSTTKAEYSTVNCASFGSSAIKVRPIRWTADDVPQIADDSQSVEEYDINVVVPNAATTSWVTHWTSGGGQHIGDWFSHNAFYQPSTVSPQNPAPSVGFNKYVIEIDYEYIGTDSSDGLSASDSEGWVLARKEDWEDMTYELNTLNDFSPSMAHGLDRWATRCAGYVSFVNPGAIRLRLKYRVIEPITTGWWSHEIELHFIGMASLNDPGECHVRKSGQSKTSTTDIWAACSFHNGCPY
jgi:hypothetical protein